MSRPMSNGNPLLSAAAILARDHEVVVQTSSELSNIVAPTGLQFIAGPPQSSTLQDRVRSGCSTPPLRRRHVNTDRDCKDFHLDHQRTASPQCRRAIQRRMKLNPCAEHSPPVDQDAGGGADKKTGDRGGDATAGGAMRGDADGRF